MVPLYINNIIYKIMINAKYNDIYINEIIKIITNRQYQCFRKLLFHILLLSHLNTHDHAVNHELK